MANSDHSSTIQPVNEMVKLFEKSSDDDDDDRISKLPEPILHYILSFLSTKQAARTSVLSKSWQYQWTWVPDIDLDIRESVISLKDLKFDQIMLKIFLSRCAWCIRKLKLYMFRMSDIDPISIRFILSAAVERNVEELDLYIYRMLFELPTGLFCCTTLVVLKLCGEIMIDFGSSHVHLPSLKVLDLNRLEYKDEDSFRNLISGCPVLDYLDLTFNGLKYDTHNFHYEISSLTVRHVIFHQFSFNQYLPRKITVTAPSLERFTIGYNNAPRALVLNNISNSVHVNVDICLLATRPSSDSDYWETMKVIFGALYNVSFLELNFISAEVQSDHNIATAIYIFPIFVNLVELNLVSDRCSFPFLGSMLFFCSRLEHLTLVSKMRYPCKKPGCWISLQPVPNCLAFHLATVKFDGFEGFEGETQFTQYILNNCKVLRSMVLRYENNANLERKFGAFQKISGFVKQSRRCQITFQPLL